MARHGRENGAPTQTPDIEITDRARMRAVARTARLGSVSQHLYWSTEAKLVNDFSAELVRKGNRS